MVTEMGKKAIPKNRLNESLASVYNHLQMSARLRAKHIAPYHYA